MTSFDPIPSTPVASPAFMSAPLRRLLDVILATGAEPFVVGGAVRDHFLGRASKDVDIEVFKLPLVDLEKALDAAGFKVDAVGRTFGVLKVTVDAMVDFAISDLLPQKVTETFDVALPRKESKSGTGHRGFVVESDPSMSFFEASKRRDFTINAMGWCAKTCLFVDPHLGGLDLLKRSLRHVGPAFAEDPLRVLRACQFAARFEFIIADETIAMCQSLKGELAGMSVERFWEEWKKLLLKAERPAIGLAAMLDLGVLDLFPELKALVGVEQDPEWHPEGDCWIHNCLVVDSAARVIRDDDIKDEDDALVTMLGALCHDLGKPSVTVFTAKANDPEGEKRWRAHAHEEAGVEPTRTFLARIGCPPGLIERIVPLVAHHLKPFHLFRDDASAGAIRRLAVKAPLLHLTRVARADFLGRTTPDALSVDDSRQIAGIVWLLEKAAALKIDEETGVKPLLMGRHLLDLGMKPGKPMGDLIKAAFEVQLDGGITDEAGAIEWARVKLAPPEVLT